MLSLVCGAFLGAASPAPLFAFHNSAWLNLHLALHHRARLEEGLDKPQPGDSDMDGFKAAVTAYRPYAERDSLSDEGMRQAANAIASVDDPKVELPKDLEAPLRGALTAAMPEYAAKVWPKQLAANQKWIASVEPFVNGAQGKAIAQKLAVLYHEAWPQTPVRVDVAGHANWTGAFTTLQPTRVTVSSADPRNQGTAGAEVVFHEASHALFDRVRDALAQACAITGTRAEDAWHVFLFFTVGEVFREAQPNYVPYLYAQHLLDAPSWQPYSAILTQDWLPYVRGQRSLTDASLTVAAHLVKGDMARRYRVVHVDTVKKGMIDQFQKARIDWLKSAAAASYLDRRGVFFQIGADRFISFTAVDMLADLDRRLSPPPPSLAGAMELYDLLSDSSLVPPHANEVWTREGGLDYIPAGEAPDELGSGVVVFEQLHPGPDADSAYEQAWRDLRNALIAAHAPMRRITFYSLYGTGKLVSFWLGTDAPKVRATVETAIGKASAKKIYDQLAKAIANTETLPLTHRADLSSP